MPRMAGTVKKSKQIKRKIARTKKISQYKVRHHLVGKRLKVQYVSTGRFSSPGYKVKLGSNESASHALKKMSMDCTPVLVQ